MASHFRNLLVSKHKQVDILLDVSEELKLKIKEQADAIPYDLIVSWLDICNDLDIHYRMARNKLLHVEMGLIRIVTVGIKSIKSVSLPEVNDGQKKKLATSSPETKPDIPKAIENKVDVPEVPVVAPAPHLNTAKEEEEEEDFPEELDIVEDVGESFSPEIQEGESSYSLNDIDEEYFDRFNERTEYDAPEHFNEEIDSNSTEYGAPAVKLEPPQPSKPLPKMKPKAAIGLDLGLDKLPSLANIHENVRRNKGAVKVELPPLSNEELKRIWEEYSETHDSQLVQAQLALTVASFADEENIIVRVGGNLVRSVVQKETSLLEMVRDHFKRPNLSFQIVEDEVLVPEEKERPVVLNAKQKLEAMAKKNPKVLDLIQKFNLKINE